MVLLVDVGNTNIYVGIFDGTNMDTFRINTIPTQTVDELYHDLSRFIRHHDIDDIVVSSVVPKLSLEFKKLGKKYFDLDVLMVEPGVKTGVKVKADNPKEVGADIISVTAGLDSKEPCLIVDLGTATKLIYTSDATIFGVVIMPGLEMSIKSLSTKTALLPDVELLVPPKVLATNSANAIQSGIFYGHAAAIDGLVEKIAKEVNTQFKVILTGGLSSVISPLLNTKHTRKPRLVLEGLVNIYNKNKKG